MYLLFMLLAYRIQGVKKRNNPLLIVLPPAWPNWLLVVLRLIIGNFKPYDVKNGNQIVKRSPKHNHDNKLNISKNIK